LKLDNPTLDGKKVIYRREFVVSKSDSKENSNLSFLIVSEQTEGMVQGKSKKNTNKTLSGTNLVFLDEKGAYLFLYKDSNDIVFTFFVNKDGISPMTTSVSPFKGKSY